MDSEPVQRCDNCLKDFPESKIATHFGYCRRNIKKCPTCNQMFDINFKEEHEEEYHRKEKCPHCAKEFPSSDYKDHEKRCEHKPKFCQYCQLNVPVATFATHFAACESRTKPCTKCNKPIMNKDYLIHIVSCEGPVPQPRRPVANYQQYLQQQSKKQEVYPKPQIDRVSSRERPGGIKPRQQNKYAEITNKREDVKVYEPRILNQPRQDPNKRQYINYPPQPKPEIKKEEVPVQKRYTGSINTVNAPKKQDSRSIGIKPTALSTEQAKRPNGSREVPREVPRAPVSNKDIFPQPSVKDSKSSEKNGYFKKEEDPRAKYPIPSYSRPEEIKRPTIDNRIKNPVIPKPRQQIVRKKSPQVKQEYANHNDLGEFGLSPEEQMMQEILMQSAKEQRGGVIKKVAPSTKPTTTNVMKDVPFMEGQDFMNESFIAKQRAIQEELSRNYKGRR